MKLIQINYCKSQILNIRASAAAGVGCALATLPPDNLKTKLQRMKVGADGKMPYSGIVDCFFKVFCIYNTNIDNPKRRSHWIMDRITSIL